MKRKKCTLYSEVPKDMLPQVMSQKTATFIPLDKETMNL